jgi:ketosteroid isomerase-like protein
MMAMPDPHAFAADWIAAWNSHDLDRILSHSADDIVFLSPVAQARLGNGRVVGREALRAYWSGGLAAQPGLKFEPEAVLVGHEGLTILYRNHRGQAAAETFEFGPDGRVVRSFACYRSLPG